MEIERKLCIESNMKSEGGGGIEGGGRETDRQTEIKPELAKVKDKNTVEHC